MGGVREEVGLHTINHYVRRRQNTVAQFIVTQLILKFCMEVERKRGTQCCQYWWEQPMDLDAAKGV